MNRKFLMVVKMSIVLAIVTVIIITLVTDNREYFRGMVFCGCMYQLALFVRGSEKQAAAALEDGALPTEG